MFQADIEASTPCLDPATSAASLLDQYDDTMSALLDKHAPLQTRTIHLDIFKEQKRHVNKLISSAKSSYYTVMIIEAASDQKQLYNMVNTMLVKPELSQFAKW